MNGGYDTRFGRGPGDIVDAIFTGNTSVQATLAPATLTIFNIFGGNSFYLNWANVYITGSSTGTPAATNVMLYIGPNAGSLVGASSIIAATVLLPTSTYFVTPVFNLSSLGFRNRTGANAYFHVGVNNTMPTAYVVGTYGGGQTSLLS